MGKWLSLSFERDKLSLIDSAFIPFTPMNQRFENKAFYMEKIIINEEDLERFEKSDMKLGHYDLVLKDRESNPTGGIADFYSQKYIYSDVTYKKEKNLLVFEIQGDSTNRERYLCTK